MKIFLLTITASIFISVLSIGQSLSGDFEILKVNKLQKDFPDEFNLSSPLKSRITLGYIWINGTDGLYRKIRIQSGKIFDPPEKTPNKVVSENARNFYLNSTISEIILYKDSLACAITRYKESRYSCEYFELDKNQWLYSGGDPCSSLEECHKQFNRSVSYLLTRMRKSRLYETVPQDTLAFVNYLKRNSRDATEFVLDKLKNHKLVMFGEIHFRKASWDFCSELVKNKRFAKSTGVVFLEFGSNMQKDIDQFFANDTIDKELLLGVFREYMVGGWADKGRYDFIIDIWKLNKRLPENRKIKVILVDTPRPISTFKSREEMRANDAKYDRDVYMANTIREYLNLSRDKRNALFIVGTAHICKTLSSTGSILSKGMRSDVYTIFTHGPRCDNFRNIPERIRHGMFDYAFYLLGDRPIGFELKDSPFGKEPFDGLFFDGSGTYQDNYDAYLFFGSLDNEPNGEFLFDIFNESFIQETNRILGFSGTNIKDNWGLTEVSKKGIMEKFLKDYPDKKWGDSIKPLQDGKLVK
ncbi:MAG: hypothetical protein WCW62_10370 [Bacteroidales bacterium]|jgi:hypothetical protein